MDVLLKEKLQKYKEKNEQIKFNINWDRIVNIFVGRVGDIYKEIDAWLAPYQQENLISYDYDQEFKTLQEDGIDSYKINVFRIFIPNKIIKIVPSGVKILGSHGRIDMHFPFPVGTRKAVLLDDMQYKESQSSTMSYCTAIFDTQYMDFTIPIEERMQQARWYFVVSERQNLLLPVTEQNFMAMIDLIVS